MGRLARQKKMKAVNDLHKYHRGPRKEGGDRAPDAEDLVPEDLPAAFASAAARLGPNTGALSKASQRRLKRAKKEQEGGGGDADEKAGEESDDGEGSVPVPVPRAKKEKKQTPAALLPGESYAAFARRVNKETKEKLDAVNVELRKPLQKRKKEYLEKKKLKKKKGKTEEEDDGPDFVHTDKVRFGEQAQAPPKLTPPNFKKKPNAKHVERAPAPASSLPPDLEKLRQQYIEAYRQARAKGRANAAAK